MYIETEREFYVGALVHHRIVNNNDPVPSVLVTAREFDLVDQALATMQQ